MLECEEDFLKEDKYYSEITEEDYCCEECRKKAEQEYKKGKLALFRL